MTEDILLITYEQAESASASILEAKKKVQLPLLHVDIDSSLCQMHHLQFVFLSFTSSFFPFLNLKCCILYERQTTTVVNHD